MEVGVLLASLQRMAQHLISKKWRWPPFWI